MEVRPWQTLSVPSGAPVLGLDVECVAVGTGHSHHHRAPGRVALVDGRGGTVLDELVMFGGGNGNGNGNGNGRASFDVDDVDDDRRQFTVTSLQAHEGLWEKITSLIVPEKDADEFLYSPSAWFVSYINWTFQWGFTWVFLSFLAIFMLLTFAFGGFLKLAGDQYPGCIVVSGEQYGYNDSTRLADAFALSWTTFTTVGYGMIYTSTGTDYGDQGHCSLIVFLCTTESFVGLLYAGMCAAILFGKVGRVQSHAQVKFSHALCVKLGTPAEDGDNSATTLGMGGTGTGLGAQLVLETPTSQAPSAFLSDTPGAESQMSMMSPMSTMVDRRPKISCPVLTFQVINKLANTPGGEIMDANMRAVASNRGATGRSGANSSSASDDAVSSFIKVQLAEFEHPYFNRVWQGRHVLDGNSPLLTPAAKEAVRRNGGYWPAEWNNPKDVREAMRLNSLIVILTGISNVSAATVHGYKKFQYGDLLVGYEFAPVLYKSEHKNRLKVDFTLTNDVVEQAGGVADVIAESEQGSERGKKRGGGTRSSEQMAMTAAESERTAATAAAQRPGVVYSKSVRLDVRQ